MRKMPCVFMRDFPADRSERVCRDEVTPGCEWVLNGEGVATRKWDGTACLVCDGKLFARFDAKRGKAPPSGFEPCQPEPDSVTGHWPGWILVDGQPQYVWHSLTWKDFGPLADGTYELCGPKVNSNHEKLDAHVFIKHGDQRYASLERTWAGIRAALESLEWEGFVFHHPDGRMAKIRRADFLLPWPVSS